MAMSAKMRARLERMKHRGRRIASKVAGGMKGTVYAAVAGAGGYYLCDLAVQKIDFLKKDYVLPGVLIGGGHFLKRKQYDVGTALIAIGAFLGAQTFKTNSDKGSNTTTITNPAGTASTTVPATGVAGWGMLDGGNSGALPESSRTSASPDTRQLSEHNEAGALFGTSTAMSLQD